MTKTRLIMFLFARFALAQGLLPWGEQAVSVPMLAAQPGVAMFYVSSYVWAGNHTDYDMARQAADAYLAVNPQTRTFIVLGPAQTQTCDAVPLPSRPLQNGTSASVSIIGYGSNVSTLLKRPGCTPSFATLDVKASSASGPIVNALYQGFSVSANHVDTAACGFYGLANSTFLDLACGNALPGSDHEVEFGEAGAGAIGQVHNVSILNLKAYDNVGTGKGAILLPQWSGSMLTSVIVSSGGTNMYTQQYTRAQVVGPDLSSCTIVPTVVPSVSHLGSVTFSPLPETGYGYITGATVKNMGSCSRTARLYLLVQDGVPVTYGMKFSNLVASRVWNLESTASSFYGEAWLRSSNSNSITGEHTYTNQTIQILEYASSNQHYNAFFDGPGEYGAAIYGKSGSFTNSIFSWDSAAYLASSGYYFEPSSQVPQHWAISNSQCTDSSANFISISTAQGPLLATDPAPSGTTLNNIEDCDGSNSVDWATPVAQD